jgi:hypothetical protein
MWSKGSPPPASFVEHGRNGRETTEPRAVHPPARICNRQCTTASARTSARRNGVQMPTLSRHGTPAAYPPEVSSRNSWVLSGTVSGFHRAVSSDGSRRRAPGDEWLHEVKYDGYRSQVHVKQGKVTIYRIPRGSQYLELLIGTDSKSPTQSMGVSCLDLSLPAQRYSATIKLALTVGPSPNSAPSIAT